MDAVVVGAGLGGLRTVEHLRRGGWAGGIVLVGGEVHAPYDRPPLTKQVLRGESDDTSLRAELSALEVDVRLGVRAVSLDAAARTVVLADGTRLAYDRLVLAPGGVPRRLPGSAGLAGVHVVRTIDDARALREAIGARHRIVVIGGGFIGCEVAASARALGASVDLVEALPAPLIRVLGPQGARVVERLLTSHDVRVHTGLGVAAVLGDDAVTGVQLSDGTVLDTADVVLGLGVVPDVAWLEGSGLLLEDGIVCDAGGRTSLPDVHAVGDAARWFHPLAGGHRRLEHWTSTADQAAVVAANVVAANVATVDGPVHETEDVPYFWSDQFDVKIQALGFIDPADHASEFSPGGRTVLVYSVDDRVTGVVGFSAARWVMRLRPLVASRARLPDVAAMLSG